MEKLLDSRTAYLQPLIDFLIARGNLPWLAATSRPLGEDGFMFDRDGFGTFYFTDALDFVAVLKNFALPDTILFTPGGVIWDERNLVGIAQAAPVVMRLPLDAVYTLFS